MDEPIREFLLLLAGIAGIASGIVEISPLKLNPWGWVGKQLKNFGKLIGRAINGELSDKVDKLADDIASLRNQVEEESATSCRTRILRFGDEILHGTRHSKEHFDQILLDISKYEKYCKENPKFKNNVALATIEKIKRTYQSCFDNNSFL